MWTPYQLRDGKLASFTAGWMTYLLRGHRVVYHSGADTFIYAHRIDDRVSVIFLPNRHAPGSYDMVETIFRFYEPHH